MRNPLRSKQGRRLLISLSIVLLGIPVRALMVPDMRLGQHVAACIVMFVLIQIVWEIYERIHKWLNRVLPFDRNLYLRLGVQLVLGVVIFMGFRFAGFQIFKSRIPFPLNNFTLAITLVANIAISLAINLAFIAEYFIFSWKESLIRSERLEKEKVKLQYAQLAAQVDPHFLFNALSSLDSLVKTQPELASLFIGHLSRIYRYVLQNKDREIVSLRTEMEFISHYISLQQMRFREALKVELRISEEALQKRIVMVVLQTLIDNAIKHNEMHLQHPLLIKIYDEDGKICVRNNKQLKRQLQFSSKQGLAGLKGLYEFLSDKPVEVLDEEETFTVKIPLL